MPYSTDEKHLVPKLIIKLINDNEIDQANAYIKQLHRADVVSLIQETKSGSCGLDAIAKTGNVEIINLLHERLLKAATLKPYVDIDKIHLCYTIKNKKVSNIIQYFLSHDASFLLKGEDINLLYIAAILKDEKLLMSVLDKLVSTIDDQQLLQNALANTKKNQHFMEAILQHYPNSQVFYTVISIMTTDGLRTSFGDVDFLLFSQHINQPENYYSSYLPSPLYLAAKLQKPEAIAFLLNKMEDEQLTYIAITKARQRDHDNFYTSGFWAVAKYQSYDHFYQLLSKVNPFPFIDRFDNIDEYNFRNTIIESLSKDNGLLLLKWYDFFKKPAEFILYHPNLFFKFLYNLNEKLNSYTAITTSSLSRWTHLLEAGLHSCQREEDKNDLRFLLGKVYICMHEKSVTFDSEILKKGLQLLCDVTNPQHLHKDDNTFIYETLLAQGLLHLNDTDLEYKKDNSNIDAQLQSMRLHGLKHLKEATLKNVTPSESAIESKREECNQFHDIDVTQCRFWFRGENSLACEVKQGVAPSKSDTSILDDIENEIETLSLENFVNDMKEQLIYAKKIKGNMLFIGKINDYLDRIKAEDVFYTLTEEINTEIDKNKSKTSFFCCRNTEYAKWLVKIQNIVSEFAAQYGGYHQFVIPSSCNPERAVPSLSVAAVSS